MAKNHTEPFFLVALPAALLILITRNASKVGI